MEIWPGFKTESGQIRAGNKIIMQNNKIVRSNKKELFLKEKRNIAMKKTSEGEKNVAGVRKSAKDIGTRIAGKRIKLGSGKS